MPKKFLLCNEEMTECIPIDEGTLMEVEKTITERIKKVCGPIDEGLILDFRLKSRRIRACKE